MEQMAARSVAKSDKIDILQRSLAGLRSRFEAGATRFLQVRCSICREPFDNGKTPILDAYYSDEQPGEGLRPYIHHDVDGMASFGSGSICRDNYMYHHWFVHERYRDVRLRSSHGFIDEQEFLVAQQNARQCEVLFNELSREGARLLQHLPSIPHPELQDLLTRGDLSYTSTLWIVSVFWLARRPPIGTALRTTILVPNCIEIDWFEATSSKQLPDSVILNLDTNPFSASTTLIDVLLECLCCEQIPLPNPDGPCGAYQWRKDGELLSAAMAPGPWKLVNHLWNLELHEASFEDLLIPIYGDANHIADRVAFGSLRREANAYFADNEIPWRVALKKTKVILAKKEFTSEA